MPFNNLNNWMFRHTLAYILLNKVSLLFFIWFRYRGTKLTSIFYAMVRQALRFVSLFSGGVNLFALADIELSFNSMI